jgi:ribosomal protein S27AE
MAYYNPGEKVTYMPTGDSATILKDLPNDEYVIEFDNAHLVPPKMTVKGNRLSPKPITLYGGYVPPVSGYENHGARDQRFIDKDSFCPKCDIPWKKTEGFMRDYYDCSRCGLKKEKA